MVIARHHHLIIILSSSYHHHHHHYRYPRYDGYNNLTFFKPFANWDSVNIKQTNGDVSYCNITQVDSNYSDNDNDNI